ncbi:MAG: hypothetical protein F4218_00510 [Synechococcus sp. SB0677_bin_5]|nr:hypothetical protein [Synechococcus sp. SB0664_bin_36]MYF19147.1 hypothetical protein [Synechococcus sp. SB0677_bin_5]MYK06307.1 hypothetical protein [Synechococcus sp. SB0670_bin_20]
MPMVGLYDACGILRFAGHESADCLAYAEFFELQDGDFTVEPLLMGRPCRDGGDPTVAYASMDNV